MTLLEAVKMELDSLPEDMLLAVQDFIDSQKNEEKEMSDTEYLMSIPRMREIILAGIAEPISECKPLREVWPDV
jgi:hypothetical protein